MLKIWNAKGRIARCSFEETLDAVLDVYLERKDLVVRANRILTKKARKAEKMENEQAELCTYKVETEKYEDPRSMSENIRDRRIPLTAEEKHIVFARDGGCCTHINKNGERCSSDRWLHIHHLRPVSLDGSNDPSNLTTLCSDCHDFCHQYVLPIEGEYSRLRSPQRIYELKVG